MDQNVNKSVIERDGYERLVYIFQGGGALGAFQFGAYTALIETGYHPDWICGISIGAINAAILAGNRLENRVEKLNTFWQRVGIKNIFPNFWDDTSSRKFDETFSAQWALTIGINGFFQKRPFNPWFISNGKPDEISFYDTSALRETLLELIDFKYLNQAHVRLSVGATNITKGKQVFFDNTQQKLSVEHIMASGALPPGFPAICIDNEYYWDGGVFSNSPISLVVNECEEQDTLCFMIDLFSTEGTLPHSMDSILAREKDIRYASRSISPHYKHKNPQNLQRAIRKLGTKLTKEQLNDPEIKQLLSLGTAHSLHIAHIIYHTQVDAELQSKDYEFSEPTIAHRIKRGYEYTKTLIKDKRAEWIKQAKDPNIIFFVEEENICSTN